MNLKKLSAFVVLGLLAVGVPLAALGCGGGDSTSAPAVLAKPPACKRAELASWQKLANEIEAPVYCPSWLPHPLAGTFGGRYFNGRSVDPDRSYLVSFVWFESGQGLVNEVHVNLRAYPGKTRIPTCEDTLTVGGQDRTQEDSLLQRPPGNEAFRWCERDRVHGESGRRPVARAVRVAPERHALHPLGARCRSVQPYPGRVPPRPDDAPARAGPSSRIDP